MTVAVGSDHAGFELAEAVAKHLAERHGLTVRRFGAMNEEAYDYPLAADSVAEAIMSGEVDMGVLVCGSGVGVSIQANRYSAVRAALCTTVELGRLSRQHNHANVLCLGQRIVEQDTALEIVDAFFSTAPDLAERHQKRVDLLSRNVSC